jgi:nucleoside-diphosphate-sugar epimerase
MNILLTGSNGFLGKTFHNFLIKENSVFTLNRNNSDYNYDLSLHVPNFKQYFDIVIHAAGKAHLVPRNSAEGNLFEKNNINGTINLLKGFDKDRLPKKFIFISSVSVYGRNSGELISEDTPLEATDYYGLSKIKTEQILINWCMDNNINLTILRLPLVVGKNPPGNLLNMVNAINNGRYFNIGNGDARKSMVLAEDIAKYLLISSNHNGIFNLTDGKHPSFKEISQKIANDLNKKNIFRIPYSVAYIIAFFLTIFGSYSPFNLKVLNKMTKTLTFSDDLAKKTFNWTPQCILNFNFLNNDSK